MSLDTTTQSKQPTEDETQTSCGGGGRKTSTMKPTDQQQIIIKCPRCDSPNTKFCYYNNYSLTQPRHFCKTCRRYWTKGGALRNVPIGGGCRKNKKTRSSSLRFMNADSSSKDSSLDIGGLSLFSGLSPPAMDFQLAGLNQFPSSSNNPPPAFLNLDSLGLNFPLMKQDYQHHHQLHGGLPNFQNIGVTNNLASSIESLSSINQDLHWKLQQQRLAALFSGGGGGGETDHRQQQQNQIVMESQSQKLQPILFHNLEIPKPSQASISMAGDSRKDSGGLETEWFFDNSTYVDPTTAIAPADTNPSGNYQNGSINNWNNNGVQVWNQFDQQYSALP